MPYTPNRQQAEPHRGGGRGLLTFTVGSTPKQVRNDSPGETDWIFVFVTKALSKKIDTSRLASRRYSESLVACQGSPNHVGRDTST